jgi:oxygen-dependent protoporphyrinogen oxidase
VRASTPVRAVEAGPSGVEVAGDGWSERFDAAVVALPAPAARTVAGNGMPAMAAWLEGVTVRPTVTMALVTTRPLGTRWFGLSYARGESRAVAAACVQEAKETALVPHGMGALLALPLPDVGPRLLDATPEQALHALLPDLAKPFPRLESYLHAAELFRWEHGWTVFRPGSLEHLSRARAGALESDARIAFAGDYLHAPNVEGAVTTGLSAADRILAALRASSETG